MEIQKTISLEFKIKDKASHIGKGSLQYFKLHLNIQKLMN